MEGNEAAKLAAIASLEMFGPQFSNCEAKWDRGSQEKWLQALAEAQAGLLMNFGIPLKAPTQTAGS